MLIRGLLYRAASDRRAKLDVTVCYVFGAVRGLLLSAKHLFFSAKARRHGPLRVRKRASIAESPRRYMRHRSPGRSWQGRCHAKPTMPAHLRTTARTASSQCFQKPNQFGGRLTPTTRWSSVAYPPPPAFGERRQGGLARTISALELGGPQADDSHTGTLRSRNTGRGFQGLP
jgi:hypothetical protein